MEIVYEGTGTTRLDKFLVESNIEELYSRTFIDKLISKGAILVDDKPVKKSHQLRIGEKISITIPESKKTELQAEKIDREIVFEDEYLAIINKPAGMTVHPAPGVESGTLVNAILHHFGNNLSSGSEADRPGIVHRLDKDTSGLLIIAKNDRTHSLLSQLLQDRKIDKYYTAIIVGEPSEKEGTIRTFIARSRSDRKKMAVSDDGKEAVTHYRITGFYDAFSVVEVKLETGRTHQIRVHFSHLNCPILGDMTYSSLKRTLNMTPYSYQKRLKHLLANHLKRQALHASLLRFKHPVTGEMIEVGSAIPPDMAYCLDWLESNFSE